MNPDSSNEDRFRCFTIGEIFNLATSEGHSLTLYPLTNDDAKLIMDRHDGIVVGTVEGQITGHASAKIDGVLLDWHASYTARLFIKWN